MGSTRQRSDRPDSARRRQLHTPEQLESRLVLSAALPGFLSLYTPSDLYVTNPITNQRIPISARDLMQHNNPNSSILSNQGKIVSGTDRAGDQWTITVHGPGQVIVTDTTPNDGALDDDIATIQIINSSLQSTYVTGTVIASSRVLTSGQVLFDRLIANSGVRSIVLNGFDLSANVTPAVDQTPGIFLYGGVQTLKFNDIDAIIDTASSGNPTVTGSLPSGVSGTVDQAPAITSADDAAFTIGQFGSFTITTTGYPTPAITETGSLPPGVTFTDNGNGTATLAGTPQEGTLGTYSLTLTAANGISPSATQSFTLTVNPQYQIVIGDPSTPLKVKPSIYLDSIINSVFTSPAITSADNAAFTVGQAGSFTITTTGFPTPSLSETGTLPSGVTFVDNGNGTATLAGTPQVGTGGIYPLTFTAANGFSATQNFTLTVNQAPAITSATSTTFTTGFAGSFTVTTTGFPTPTLSETGVVPGVSFNPATGVLSGTPSMAGTYPLTFTAANTVSSVTQSFTLTVVAAMAPAITSATSTTFATGTAGSFTVTTTGTPTPTLTESGALPSGVTFVPNGNGTATLSGTPAAGTGGTYPLTFTAANGVTPNATQSFTLTVVAAPALAITSATSTPFTTGFAGSFTVTTTGTPTPALTETVTLPTGVTFVDNGNGTATLASTTATPVGTYPLKITATNTVSSVTQSFTLTVAAALAPTITSATSTTFTTGIAGSFTVTTTGTPTPTLSETGALPSGVTFNAATATLSGTPAAGTGGTYPLTFTAANGVGSPATQNFTLTVNQAPAITSATSTPFTTGIAGSFTVTTTGFPTPTLTETGALPSGVSFNQATGVLSGTPSMAGTYPLTFTAANTVSSVTQSFTLTVAAALAPTITSATSTTFTTGIAGSFTVTTTGTPTPTLTETGALPSGVTFNAATATLSGTPAAGTEGTYPLTFTATNGVTPNATQTFTLTVILGPPTTTPSVLFSINGVVQNFNVVSITQSPVSPNYIAQSQNGTVKAWTGVPQSGPIPAGYQFEYSVVGTTGRTSLQALAINHLNVVGKATNFTAQRHDALRVKPQRSEVHPAGDVWR